MKINLSNILKSKKVISKAPTRVDLGGGIDHRLISLICNSEHLETFNIALQLYTKVELTSYKKGVLVYSKELGQQELNLYKPRFTDKFGLISAIVQYFDITGVKIHITNDYPIQSGLGGSGSLAVALINAIVHILNLQSDKVTYYKKDIVWLAHSIEDSLFKNTGMQDQAVACFGGINVWRWKYGNHNELYSQIPIKNHKN